MNTLSQRSTQALLALRFDADALGLDELVQHLHVTMYRNQNTKLSASGIVNTRPADVAMRSWGQSGFPTTGKT